MVFSQRWEPLNVANIFKNLTLMLYHIRVRDTDAKFQDTIPQSTQDALEKSKKQKKGILLNLRS